MPIQLGDKALKSLYIGDKKVFAVYIGDKKVRPSAEKYQINENTKFYWELINNKNDYGPTASHLTGSGVRLTELNGVKCAKFSGNRDQIHYLKNDGKYTNFTFGVWWYPIEYKDMYFLITNGGGYNSQILCTNRKGELAQRYWRGYSVVVGKSTPIVLNQRNHYVSVRDGGIGKLYLNGVLIASGAVAIDINRETRSLGGQAYYNQYYLSGYCREMFFESKAWSEKEIKSLYERTKSLSNYLN